MADAAPSKNRVPLFWRVVHAAIVANLLAEIAYAGWMVLFVLVPPGGGFAPLGRAALALPHDLMMTRRLYALEAWVAVAGLSVYLGVTEIAPRFWKRPR